MEIPSNYIKNVYKVGLVLLAVLALYFAVRVLAEFRSYSTMGSMGYSITLSGHGEVSAAPDIATISFSINKEGKTVKEAQDAVAVVEKAALEVLKANGIEDKDIKTLNASFNPKYQYVYDTKVAATCSEWGCPPRPGKNVVTGYEAFENITVKIRNIDNAGKVIQDLGKSGVTDLNGPNFAIDDEDALKAEARKEAIAEARAKAKVLAKDLGVRLGKVVSFSENGDYPMPMYYAKDMAVSAGAPAAPAELPKGENTISSDVSITYEIK